MPTDPRATVVTTARSLLASLCELPALPALRVTESEGGLICLIQVWNAAAVMPTARAEKKTRPPDRRAGCREDILTALRTAGEAMTRKELIRALREAKAGHGPGTVAKALADLTAAGQLINPKDKRGYRLAEWPRRPVTPSLFS